MIVIIQVDCAAGIFICPGLQAGESKKEVRSVKCEVGSKQPF
jgi:hypothetical protein